MLEEATYVLDVLKRNGYQAYFVGGYVRDRVAGREGKDIDIATSATPEEVCRLFPRTVPTGMQHGTVTVVCPHHTFEVTTFRAESQYEKARRPKEVQFIGDLLEDLKRRDFTMNAMAMDRDGRLIDPFGGQRDLKDGVLRCVGDPVERFSEDALRMLRCIRFAAEYGLEIDGRTWQALLEQRDKLRLIAMERVRMEWEGMIAGRDPHRALRLLFESGLLGALKTQTGLPCERWTPADMPPSLARLGDIPAPADRWALFMLAQGADGDLARRALLKMTFSRAAALDIAAVVACDARMRAALRGLADAVQAGGAASAAGSEAAAAKRELARLAKRAAVRHGVEIVRRWLMLAPLLPPLFPPAAVPADTAPPTKEGAVSAPGSAPDSAPESAAAPPSVAAPPVAVTAASASADDTGVELYRLLIRHGAAWLDEMPAAALAQLAVDGSDIARALGREPGPWLGSVLGRLLEDVALGDVANERDRLLERAKTYGENI
jgi:tRNA nucleotidyltransferase (CCA-adding enzyme)